MLLNEFYILYYKMERSKQARSLKERSKQFIPFWMQKFIYVFVKKCRFLKYSASRQKITKEYLKNIFQQAGLKKGDIVVVHSSLGRIGYVEGGAGAVIDAFLEIVGKEGLLIMPAFSALHYDAKRRMHVFNVQNTPTYTGAIPETFRKRKGVYRSISPTHSYCAFGKRAAEFVKNHENCDNPFSMDGPFGKLYHWNAKIFLIGVDQLANTPLHIVEDKTNFPVKVFTNPFKVIVRDCGKEKIIEAKCHLDCLRKHRDPNILEKYCKRYSVMDIYSLGNTRLRVLNTKNFVDMMEKLVAQHITIYTPR